jgi:glycosyltransferase involved in cell wall biosynthesis
MMELAKKLKIEDKVTFLGVRSDIGCQIASSHLMLLPSQQESFGLAALEAMACKVPVAASRIGGLPEVIEDGRSGILFTLGDTDEAAEKAVRILKDKTMYNSIVEEAFKDARGKFSMEKITGQYEQLYRE